MTDDQNTDGQDTRTRLIESSLEVFGQRGFDAVRTRELADAARVNQSAIPYYFSGKKGLYLAVTEHLAQNEFKGILGFVDQELEGMEGASREGLIRTLGRIMKAFAHGVVGSSALDTRTRFVAREQLEPTEAFDLLYDSFFGPFHHAVSSVVAKLMHRDSDDPEAVTLAHIIIGQVLVFAVAKHTYVRRLGLEDLDEDDVDRIGDMVETVTRSVCEGLG